MVFLKEQYRQSFSFLRGPLQIYLRNTVIAFFVILLIFYGVCLFRPDVLSMLISYIQSVVENANISDNAGNYSALRILLNNLRASALSVIYGFIPFLFLPALPIGMNAAILGALGAYYQVSGQSMLLLLAGILPHGIFEIPALMIAFASGLYLCHGMTDMVLGKQEGLNFPALMLPLVRIFLTIVIPMLIAAAFIEAYITPVCMSFFM